MIKAGDSIKPFVHLLDRVGTLLAHQEEVERLKGEKFNIFSILRVDGMEDRLHSHFIKELLDPCGSHLKKDIFLKLFLQVLNEKYENLGLNEEYNEVHREYHIGSVDLEAKTGGRLDILIRNMPTGHTICIENKIYADDQNGQILRYFNFNRSRQLNKVFYLTLYGNEPKEKSCGNLVCGEDFYLLSYSNDILRWLELCLKEAHDEPILRESIRQYLILIKKLTHTMNDKFEDDLLELVIKNLKQAEFITSTYQNSLGRIRQNLREAVMNQLNKKLSKYKAYMGKGISAQYAQIWIKATYNNDPVLKFGIETFSGDKSAHDEGALMIGTFKRKKNESLNEWKSPHLSIAWIEIEGIKMGDNQIHLGKSEFLEMIKDKDHPDFDKLRDTIVEHTIAYIRSIENSLKDNVSLSLLGIQDIDAD